MILCAKLFQTLANGNRFDVGYMQAMNPFLARNEGRFVAFCAKVVVCFFFCYFWLLHLFGANS